MVTIELIPTDTLTRGLLAQVLVAMLEKNSAAGDGVRAGGQDEVVGRKSRSAAGDARAKRPAARQEEGSE